MNRPYAPVIHGAADDRPDEQDSADAAKAVAGALERLGYRTEIIALGLDLSPLAELSACRPTVVVNLVDALAGIGALFPLTPLTLGALGAPFTGARGELCMALGDKIAAKRLLREAGLPTPDWWTDGSAAPDAAMVIVKSLSEHASIGIDAGSIVTGAAAEAEIATREARFGGRFFAEAFVEGREFNLALLEDEQGVLDILPIPEIVFDDLPPGRPHIVDYEAKWMPESDGYRLAPRRFGLETREPALAAELRRLATEAWRALGLDAYTRIDFRVGVDGRPTILEVNVNPCLAPDAGFAVAAAEAGLTYDALIARIVAAGARGEHNIREAASCCA